MNIDSIREGYVIDHIKAGKSLKIYEYLGLEHEDAQVAIIKNARSKKMGRKDIIKIAKKIDLNVNILGYIDPDITVNVIENDKIIGKIHPELPEVLENIVKCKNPRCITTVEKGLKQICILTDRENKVYRCKYCETRIVDR